MAFGGQGRARPRLKDIDTLCRVPLLTFNELDDATLQSHATRSFLGWCPKALNVLGESFLNLKIRLATCSNHNSPATPQLSYAEIGYTKLPRLSKAVVSLIGASLGFSSFANGGASFAFGKKDGIYHASNSGFYEDLLEDCKQLHVILQTCRTDVYGMPTASG